MNFFIGNIPASGSIVNCLAVIVGSTLGLLFRSRLPQRYINMAFQVLGLFTLFLGFLMAQKTANFLILVFSMVGGGMIGEALDLDGRFSRFSEKVSQRFKTSGQSFAEGFLTSTLLFCIGSMAILGAIEEGLGLYPNLLITKSLLDGVSSLALATSLGGGVLLSAFSVLFYQGGLTLLASSLQPILSESVINEISAAGGLMLIALGLSLLEIKRFKVTNMLPALVIAAILGSFFVH
ncbi:MULTISPECIES: DUF554 domain-containing protein [Aminobacterium]|uniref:DUF554 domain-containing protein n=1 Tax=Aminobacterium colombiense (strain DSM 12261 / ALA-1) TaxID=572547 RepID=D5ECV3_AMICL|nr:MULTISPECIES: DUF554 domain-containing protein [Aminobacterium]MDD2379185.1 DUF554 domain-containing protein [Aminobacterium colombiense]ADE56385.1 protein of unknown function DUF554 [Aminobacterium colombiense DSM 12261]MDD4265418.1 DUF554 domain-containing protein [Aminobacterium colombiense]MDD4586115.1 DUF554 domain-containing protein [Aminobacterium colombiense]NLK30159.1 DUF554 domain-containing protein [Aminobacterium colombiense]